MEQNKIFEIKTQELDILPNTNDELVFRGNNAYDKALGLMVYVVNKATGLEISGKCNIQVAESSGRVILPSVPYNLVKPSQMLKFDDRFITFDKIDAVNQDLKIRVANKNTDATTLTVSVSVAYSASIQRR